jgi:hypothetical protein
MVSDRPVQADDAAFEAHISPLREALRDLLDVSDALREEAGALPDADSRVMAELAEETRFARPGRHPAQAAHDLSQLLLFGLTDRARAAIRLLSSDPTPVFAHVVLGRASIEHAGRAWWLLDPGIDVRLRVARAMNERLFGYEQQARLPLNDEDHQKNRRLREELLAEADDLGFERIGPTPFLAENRPSQTELARQLLGWETIERSAMRCMGSSRQLLMERPSGSPTVSRRTIPTSRQHPASSGELSSRHRRVSSLSSRPLGWERWRPSVDETNSSGIDRVYGARRLSSFWTRRSNHSQCPTRVLDVGSDTDLSGRGLLDRVGGSDRWAVRQGRDADHAPGASKTSVPFNQPARRAARLRPPSLGVGFEDDAREGATASCYG